MARLRNDKIREFLHAYFHEALARFEKRLADKGPHPRAHSACTAELEGHISALNDGPEDFSDIFLEDLLPKIQEFAGINDLDWQENQVILTTEVRKARRDHLRAMLARIEQLEAYSFAQAPSPSSVPSTPPPEPSATLQAAWSDFLTEHSREWPVKTTKQYQGYFKILLDYFGADKRLGEISKQDATEVKKILLALPASRNTKPELKHLPLSEVVQVKGHKSISPKTINSHIDLFRRFFVWAEQHGHSSHVLFEGMKVGKAKEAETDRKPFPPEQANLIYNALLEVESKLVRKESHKWGALLGLFTGARLNEICQLEIADIGNEDGIWFLDITDVGDTNKRLKAKASKRRVPLHKTLIEAGFLNFVETRRSGTRLFPDYSYSENGGYGRSLGRWFNESFLPKLGLKEKSLVFHCLRHTMVTRLAQASVPEPIIQSIVGHARDGVTQDVYFKEGYTLAQLKEAIENYTV
ncbi:site-specific integrase [Pseudophaeobacter sp.]|uniref:site-specific integrase n=1 Tax=Pseudophaeobacter sp. TaxID=1971739 RepID=UPI0032984B92